MSKIPIAAAAPYAGYMADIVRAFGEPLAPYPPAAVSEDEAREYVGGIDSTTIRFVPITPRERVAVEGAMPSANGAWWHSPRNDLGHIVREYFERSEPFMRAPAEPAETDELIFTNEVDFASAIERISDRGGAFLGVGLMPALVYAAWQDASRAYIVERDPEITRLFTPFYGALLCTARNRAELISIISSRPLPENFPSGSTMEMSPKELLRTISKLPVDYAFGESAISAIAGAVASSGPKSWRKHAHSTVRSWIQQIRSGFLSDAPDLKDEDSPLWQLTRGDSKGRGAPLASEESFRRGRRLFIDGRVTGVHADIAGTGFELVGNDLRQRELDARVVYLSNAEDSLYQELVAEGSESSPEGAIDISSRMFLLYAELHALGIKSDSLVISAKGLNPTYVDGAMEYAHAAYPIGASPKKGVDSMSSFYRFRLAIARARKHPLRRRLTFLMNDVDIDRRMQAILVNVKSAFHGNPMGYSYLEKTLRSESAPFRNDLSNYEQDLLLYNMVILGIARMPGEGRQELIIPS